MEKYKKENIMKHSIEQRIHFYQCDPAGILYFANIYNIAHDAFEELFLLKYINLNDYKGYLLPIVHSEADYKKPLRFNDIIETHMILESIGEHSFTFKYDIFNKSIGLVAATVKITHTLIETKTFQKVKLFPEIIEILNKFK